MLLSIVLIKYKYFNFAQGSRILTIFTYSYTIDETIVSHKISLIVKVCYESLHKGVLHTSCVCILETDPWLVKSSDHFC